MVVKQILYKGKVFSVMLDNKDEGLYNQHVWHLSKQGNFLYVEAWVGNKRITLHRLLLGFPMSHTDHKNGNTLDNRRRNLRECTHAQNQWNRQFSSGRSKYKGVSWCSSTNKWKVRVKKNRKEYWVGRFDSETEAAKEYDKKAVELFGSFARLNFPCFYFKDIV